jgi:hypothetical protein
MRLQHACSLPQTMACTTVMHDDMATTARACDGNKHIMGGCQALRVYALQHHPCWPTDRRAKQAPCVGPRVCETAESSHRLPYSNTADSIVLQTPKVWYILCNTHATAAACMAMWAFL